MFGGNGVPIATSINFSWSHASVDLTVDIHISDPYRWAVSPLKFPELQPTAYAVRARTYSCCCLLLTSSRIDPTQLLEHLSQQFTEITTLVYLGIDALILHTSRWLGQSGRLQLWWTGYDIASLNIPQQY